MKYKIWNKEDSINNASAEYIINDLKISETDEVFLVTDDADNVCAIEIARIIKSVYGLDTNLTVDEVAAEYIRIHEQQNEVIQTPNDELENEILELEKRIEDLENLINKNKDESFLAEMESIINE